MHHEAATNIAWRALGEVELHGALVVRPRLCPLARPDGRGHTQQGLRVTLRVTTPAAGLYAAGLARDQLIHLDYHPINVLTDGRRITAVLDWSTAAAGDRRIDLARTSALLEAGPIPPSRLKPIASIGRSLFCRAWRTGYARASGPCADLAAFQVWAGETFVRDLESRVGESQVWATPRDLESARRWTARWWARTDNH